MLMKPNQNDELAEQLLDTKKSERPKEHVLKTPKKPTSATISQAALASQRRKSNG